MEELLGAIDKSCLISQESRISDRKLLFKYNAQTVDSAREKRRTLLLAEYKRKRNALLEEKRGLLYDEFDENEDWMDWQEGKKNQGRRWINPNCKDQLMLSEWLVDHPHDLETNWTCVLCPEGRRALVVAKKGCTRAYQKKGYLMAKFKSILPNGAPSNRKKNSDVVILDCIWNEKSKQLFALDVLHWNNHQLLNCDAQFRLYWLKSKLTEVKRSMSQNSEEVYDVLLPPHCTVSTLADTLEGNDPSQVDGILFYHNNAPYISGQTPLVGWLKPYMLPERFNFKIREEYMVQKPDAYINLEDWVANVSHSHVRQPGKLNPQADINSSGNISSSEACEMEDTGRNTTDLSSEMDS